MEDKNNIKVRTGPHIYTKYSCTFKLLDIEYKGIPILVLVDLNGKKTVTNCIDQIYELFVTYGTDTGKFVIYRDSDNNWDGWIPPNYSSIPLDGWNPFVSLNSGYHGQDPTPELLNKLILKAAMVKG